MIRLTLTLTALTAWHTPALAAPVSITAGSLVYAQSFNALGTASVAWTDDATIPGWYAQINSGGTATGSAQAANGSVILSGLLNLGATAGTDRALGSKATGTGNFANIAYGVSFQNSGTNPVALTQLQYVGELWRTNSGTGTPVMAVDERYTVFFQVSSSPVSNILSGPTGPIANPGSGFSALGAGANWINPVNSPAGTALDGNAAANRTSVTFSPSGVTLLPGQFLMLKWTDANESGTDGFQGIDDVTVTFTELNAALTPFYSAVTRQDPLNTPVNPADDTFGFTVNVAGSGAGISGGWTTSSANPPSGNAASGVYGANVVWTGFPVSSAKTINFADSGNAAFTAALTVQVPLIFGTNNIAAPAPLITSGAALVNWTADEAARTLTQTGSVQGDRVVDSALIDLTGVAGVHVTASLDAIAGTSSGFEAADSFGLQLIIDGGAPVSILGPADTNGDGRLTGAAAAGGTELPDATVTRVTRPFNFTGVVPASANSLVIRVIGNSNSTSETFVVKSIVVSVSIPVRYTIGWQYDGATLTDVFSDVAGAPAAEWVNDPVLHVLNMTTGGTTDKIVASDVLDLSATGTVHFSALFRARETSTGSNFESGDRFKAELLIDGGLVPTNIINLVAAWDSGDGAAAVGTGGGPNGAPNGYLNGYQGIAVAPATTLQDYDNNRARDEFNTRAGGETGETMINNTFALSAVIPTGANSAQLRIYGAGISGSEFFTVSQVVFSTVAPTADTDGDGVPDLTELVHGTDPHDSTSLFSITGVTPDAGAPGRSLAAFPTASGRLYQGYYSTDLVTWTRDGATPVTGDGATHPWPFGEPPVPVARRYLKVVTGFSSTDFPPVVP